MTHGFMLSKYGGGVANMSRNYADIVRELRCAFACGSGMVEVYADFSLMNSINGGRLWADLAECIQWQREQADVLPDVHWVGGNPWDGSKANVYGWAAWNGERPRSPCATRRPRHRHSRQPCARHSTSPPTSTPASPSAMPSRRALSQWSGRSIDPSTSTPYLTLRCPPLRFTSSMGIDSHYEADIVKFENNTPPT